MSESGHILVAEDDSMDAYFSQRAFKRAGVPVALHFVRDGQEVIDYLQGEGKFADRAAHPLPQLVLLDLNMPRLDGFEVLEWVRKQPGFNSLQMVIFSSSDETKDMNRAYGLGANWYLVKPHSMDELTALIGRFKRFWLEGADDRGRKAALAQRHLFASQYVLGRLSPLRLSRFLDLFRASGFGVGIPTLPGSAVSSGCTQAPRPGAEIFDRGAGLGHVPAACTELPFRRTRCRCHWNIWARH